ncbi:MAG: hypothetical protein GTO12_01575 [Proteobacteria bacterium]|nr:hypothetical protein [Pseudomonadota bacterium]
MKPIPTGVVWRRWVIVNSLGELLGLGATLALGATLFSSVTDAQGTGPALLTALLMTATGALEGLIVGWAQWSVLRYAVAGITRRSWVVATIVGAILAWMLGSIPMTVAGLSGASASAVAEEPPQALVLILAAALGLGAGLILSVAQWRVLKGHVNRAWRWLPANALAWAAGMPLIFAGIDLAQKVDQPFYAILAIGSIIAIAGALVGAIHGVALIAFIPNGGD